MLSPPTPQEERTNVLGKLTWDAVPWSQPIPLVAGGVVIVAVLAVILWVIVRGYLPYLWNEWITQRTTASTATTTTPPAASGIG